MSNVLLLLAGSSYDLSRLLHQAKSCPQIEIAENELNDPNDAQYPDHKVAFSHDDITSSSLVVFYKQHGKYTILIGNELIEKQKANPKYKGKLSGYLISKPALKKARLEKEGEEEEAPPAAPGFSLGERMRGNVDGHREHRRYHDTRNTPRPRS